MSVILFVRNKNHSLITCKRIVGIVNDLILCVSFLVLSLRETEMVLRGVPTERRRPCDGFTISQYRCIERVNCSVGTLVCCDRGHSSKLLDTERVSIKFKYA